MQNATKRNHVSRVTAFPVRADAETSGQMPEVRRRFERLLIFVLCTLWAVGIVLWTLFSLAGLGHGSAPASTAYDAVTVPTSLPTLQSAVAVAARLVLGW